MSISFRYSNFFADLDSCSLLTLSPFVHRTEEQAEQLRQQLLMNPQMMAQLRQVSLFSIFSFFHNLRSQSDQFSGCLPSA